jgi:hypothetical protein
MLLPWLLPGAGAMNKIKITVEPDKKGPSNRWCQKVVPC